MMDVWHNDTGRNAGWNLDYIEVQSSAVGRVSGMHKGSDGHAEPTLQWACRAWQLTEEPFMNMLT